MSNGSRPIGELIRDWRQRRRRSQTDLARDAEISSRHLSFLETGRALPSREMVLRLAERLAVPIRYRNEMLRAAGFAGSYLERSMDDPGFRAAKQSVDLILQAHEPWPALAADRHWNVIARNRAADDILSGADPLLLRPAPNFVRVTLHPAGLAPRIVNLMEWREHLIARLGQRIEATGDAVLIDLLDEVRDYPVPPGPAGRARPVDHEIVAVPLSIATFNGTLSWFSTSTVFASPVDITLAELSIESFFPANPATAAAIRRVAERDAGSFQETPAIVPLPPMPRARRAAAG